MPKKMIQTPTGCTKPQSLFGLWAVEPGAFSEMVSVCKRIDLVALARMRADGAPSGPVPTLSPETPGKKRADEGDDEDYADDDLDDSQADLPYQVAGGVAIVSMTGPLTKYPTSFQSFVGGTSTLQMRRALRMAANDPRVNAVMIRCDSPGGTVSGTGDLAGDIRSVDAIKPVYGFAEDMCGSAAYWALSQCRKIFANSTAMVGCIGAMCVLTDTSEQLKQEGVRVQVVTSDVPGGSTAKGMGTPGTPVTDDVVGEVKRQLNDQNDLFVADVANGRELPPDRVRAMADGRVHVGEKAKALGLVDEIASFDAAMQAAYTESYQMTSDQFRAFAAANPTDPAVVALISTGKAEAKTLALNESRQALSTLVAAFPGREKFALEQFVKGHDVTAAKAELSDVLIAEMAKMPTQAQATQTTTQTQPPFAGVKMPVPGDPLANRIDAGGGAGGAIDPVTAFNGAWQALVAKGVPTNRAVAQIVREQPKLHEAYMAANGQRRQK